MNYIEASITDKQLHTNENWIYVIIDTEKRQVVYLGSTVLHPIAEMEKHISNGFLEGEQGLLKLFAFPLPEYIDRKLMKKLLIDELETIEVGELFNQIKLNAKIWKDHVEYSKKLAISIKDILAD